MTTWADLPTFVTDDIITATQLNQLRYQIRRIRQPEIRIHELNATLAKTPGTSFTSLSALTEKTFTLERAALVLISLNGSFHTTVATIGNEMFMDIELDGSRLGDTNRGLVSIGSGALTGANRALVFMRIVNMAGGSHTVKIMVKGTQVTDQIVIGASTVQSQYSIRVI